MENKLENKQDFYKELTTLISELFEIPMDEITPEARFYEDLNLDSIDAIDLIGQFQASLGVRINPEDFKTVRTVDDVVQVVGRILSERESVSQ